MVEIVPSLFTQYSAQRAEPSLDYPALFDQDNQAIIDSLTTVESSINSMLANEGLFFTQDWYRQIDASDPSHGRIGPNSLVFNDAGSSVVELFNATAGGIGSAVIAGTRRQHTGTLSLDLTTLSLSAGMTTLYLGVEAFGSMDLSIVADETVGNVQLPLYELDVTVTTAGDVTVDTVRVRSRTVLWDNTWFQQEQERPRLIAVGGTGSADDKVLAVPFQHRWTGVAIASAAIVGVTMDGEVTVNSLVSTTSNPAEFHLFNYSESGVANSTDPVADALSSVVRPAGTTYYVNVTGATGTWLAHLIGIEVVPIFVPSSP